MLSVAPILPLLCRGDKCGPAAAPAGLLCNPTKGGVEQEAGEQDQAGVAVGFEYG